MAVRTISTSIKLDGEQEFKKQMSSVNSELKTLKSEMALATAEFKGNANSMEALIAKGQLLRREYEQQAEKVRALEKAVEDASEAYKDAPEKIDNYKRQLNYAKTALVNLNAEIQDNEKYLNEASQYADRCARSIDEYGREVKQAANVSGSEYKRQMDSVNSVLETLKSEMALVTAEFRGNANSMEALTAKGQILGREYDQQAEKVRALERAVEDASKAYGEADSRTDTYRRQLNYAKTALVNLNAEIQDNEKYLNEASQYADRCARSIDEYGREVKQAGDNASKLDLISPFSGIGDLVGQLGALKGALMGGAAVAGIQALAGAITDVVDSSQEYRKIMGTLEVSSQAAGYTAEQTAQTYERLYSVLGDTQTAATTVANLQAIGLSQEDLMTITDASIGAWARYGDSIPIDTLGESINETIQAGQVTGTFADVLNWAGTSEDDFNAKLAAANSTTERAKIVLQELIAQGLAEAGQAWIDTNDDIVAANLSQAAFVEAQARLGESLSPVRDGLRDLAAGGFNFLADAAESAVPKVQELWQWWSDVMNLQEDAYDSWGTLDEAAYDPLGLDQRAEHVKEVAEEAAEVADAAEELLSADTIQTAQKAIDESADSLEALTEKTEAQKQASEELTHAEDLLSSALAEQTENKTLSLDTTLSLIDAGYASALMVDQETGAVTLNKDAYIAITKAKIDDQIASLESQRISVNSYLAMRDEALMATDLGKGYYSAAEAKAALEGKAASYDAQIAALNQLKSAISSVGTVSSATARSSASVAKVTKTQAQKDLEQYRDLVDELDHLRNMDQISETEYYETLAEYRDRYLTDDANVEEYRRVTEQIYQYDQALAEQEAKLWDEQTEELADALQDRVDTIRDHQEKMEESLADYGELFKIEKDDLSLENLQDQINAINEYEDALTRLRDRGAAQGLMDSVVNMDVDEATRYAQELLNLTEEQFTGYNDLWQEKQQRAKEVAEEFYSEQLEALGTEYSDKLGETLGELTDTAFDSGQDTVQGLLDGLSSKEQEIYKKAQEMVETISKILDSVNVDIRPEINIPEGTGNAVDGSHAGGLSYVPWDGYIAQLHQGERVLTAAEARALDTLAGGYAAPSGVTAADLRTVTASAVNALGTLGSSGGGRTVIELHWNVNGKELYRETIEDFRAVNKEIPEVLDDE